MTANSAFVGLASPGDTGSWQRENKVDFRFHLSATWLEHQLICHTSAYIY